MSAMRGVIKKSRERLLGSMVTDLEHVKSRVDEIAFAQLQINHNNASVLDEVHQRQKNSGVVQISETMMVAKIFSGLKMYLDPNDLTLAPHLALDSIWEDEITKAWLQVVQPGDVVVDIGANYGYFGALAAQKIHATKGSKFIFFEANPHLIPYIRRTLGVNWIINKCQVENYAVTEKEGEVELAVSPFYLGTASLYTTDREGTYAPYKIDQEEKILKKVKATSLDAYCAKHGIKNVNLIKMDIEGFEEGAYAGMRKTIKRSPHVTMFIEFTGESYKNPKKFYEQLLRDFGNVYKIDADGRIIKPRDARYEAVITNDEGWMMPIFSKNPKLATKK